jgi:hypothetical protein
MTSKTNKCKKVRIGCKVLESCAKEYFDIRHLDLDFFTQEQIPLVQEFLPMNTYLIARTYITYVIVYT